MYPEKKIILFTGHMIDKPDRARARFPASKEPVARKAIEEELKRIISGSPQHYSGIAGGACGGDILFHEVAARLDIPTSVYLALPHEAFIKRSVEYAGKNWVDRFNDLCSRQPVHILPDAPAFPGDSNELNLWERSNRWMLHLGLQNGGERMQLLALWNGEAGDDTGGTDHMVSTTRNAGGNVTIINTRTLFAL
jgi:hypothetical protein